MQMTTLHANRPTQATSQLHSLEQATESIGLDVNADKNDKLCFNQESDMSTLNDGSLKLIENFTYLGSSVSSAESDMNMQLVKVRTAIDRLSIISKSDSSDKLKQNFIEAVVVSILLYGYTTLTLIKRTEK